uniref:G-protein coupled receptors family 1 profile domain-containing protein n=1 Tax=Cyprinus carpio TaxID=7962 RepID=A0A8C2FE05_CYPCA
MGSITTTDTAMTVQPTRFPRVGYSILSYLMFINTIFSVFNNLLVIAVMLKNVHFLNALNVIILSLAVSDLMIASCGSALVTITNYKGAFFLGDAFCVFQGFAVNYFGEPGVFVHSHFAGIRAVQRGLQTQGRFVVVDPEIYIPPLVTTMPMYFTKTSSVYNPIIYFLTNKRFRESSLEILSYGRYIPRHTAGGLMMCSTQKSRSRINPV